MNKALTFLKSRSPLFWSVWIFLAGFFILTQALDFKAASVASWFQQIADVPYAIPATILIYTIAAFASAPQWMLHGGAVLAFGPVYGSIVAWISTMVSASVNFWLGRRLGEDRISKIGGRLVQKFISVIRRHGFWTSLTVRIVPSGPFVVINMAAGVAGMTFLAFALGTALGIIPKIIAVAFFGEGIQGAATGKGPVYVAIVIAFALAWIGIIYFAGSRLKRKTGIDTPAKGETAEK